MGLLVFLLMFPSTRLSLQEEAILLEKGFLRMECQTLWHDSIKHLGSSK